MKRSLYLRAKLFGGNEGTLLLKLSEVLQSHSIDPESLVFSAVSSDTEFRIAVVLAPCDAAWIEALADQFRTVPAVTQVLSREEDDLLPDASFMD
jgi:hypothetical protein